MRCESKYGKCRRPIQPGEYETINGEDWVKFMARWNAHFGFLEDNGKIFADVAEERKRATKEYVSVKAPMGDGKRLCAWEGCDNLFRPSRGDQRYCTEAGCIRDRRREASRRRRSLERALAAGVA